MGGGKATFTEAVESMEMFDGRQSLPASAAGAGMELLFDSHGGGVILHPVIRICNELSPLGFTQISSNLYNIIEVNW